MLPSSLVKEELFKASLAIISPGSHQFALFIFVCPSLFFRWIDGQIIEASAANEHSCRLCRCMDGCLLSLLLLFRSSTDRNHYHGLSVSFRQTQLCCKKGVACRKTSSQLNSSKRKIGSYSGNKYEPLLTSKLFYHTSNNNDTDSKSD